MYRKCIVVVVALVMAVPVQGADIWVSGSGSDGGLGTPGSPYRTISKAMNTAEPNDVIKVLTGTYDVSVGEVFPIPVKSGVDIRGQETSPASWPRIGGDVADSGVDGLFEVDATTADRGRIEFYRLWFVGEDSTGEDAPSAVAVAVAGDHSAIVLVDDCHVERSEMNDSSHGDRAALNFVIGWGECTTKVANSTIFANARGGIEMAT